MKRGNTPIFFLITVVVVFTSIGYLAFTALAGGGQQDQPSPTEIPVPTSTGLAGRFLAEETDLTPVSDSPAPTKTPVVAVVVPTMTPTEAPPVATPTPAVRRATATPVRPTATPTPADTPTPANTPTPTTPYSFQNTTWQPNCAMILIKFYVTDANGSPVNGVVFRFETVDGIHTARSNPTGEVGNPPGMTDFTVSPLGMKAATWRVWVVDGSDTPLSERVDVTSNTDCKSGDARQVATVNFRKNY